MYQTVLWNYSGRPKTIQMGIYLSPVFHPLLSKLILTGVPKLFLIHLKVNVAENKIDLK